MTRLLGAVLAGGRSRRFGSDKALAILEGRRMIDWAITALEAHVDEVVLCGRPDGIADRPAPDLGPLGGLNAALHAGLSRGFDAVLSIPCDTPAIPRDALDLLLSMGAPAYLENCPVIGIWPCSVAGALDTRLQGPDRSMRSWAQHIGAKGVASNRYIDNVNTVDELQAVARQMALAPHDSRGMAKA